MKWKSQSTHKVGEKYDPLMGFRSWSDMPLVRQPVCNVFGQVPSRSELRNMLLLHGGGHPLASCFGHDWLCGEGVNRALELEGVGMDKQRRKKAWVKMGNPYPFIEATDDTPPHFPIENRLFSKCHD